MLFRQIPVQFSHGWRNGICISDSHCQIVNPQGSSQTVKLERSIPIGGWSAVSDRIDEVTNRGQFSFDLKLDVIKVALYCQVGVFCHSRHLSNSQICIVSIRPYVRPPYYQLGTSGGNPSHLGTTHRTFCDAGSR